MPDHDKLLMALALLFSGVMLGMLVIDWLLRRRDDKWLDSFADAASVAELEAEKERFWRFVLSAEGQRLKHLDESEAAAIQHQHQIH